MTFLSRFYRLEIGEDRLKVEARDTGTLVLETAYEVEGQSLFLASDPSKLDAEAARLIIQWALDERAVPRLLIPIPSPPEILQIWVQLGARLEGGHMVLTPEAFAAANRALGCKGASWLERELPRIEVACVALINSADQVLLAQRPEGKSQAGLWELPGGKLEPGESPELALCREMHEELGVSIWNSCLAPLTFVSHAYETFHLTMFAYACYRWEGEVQGREGQAFNWIAANDLDPKIMPAANAPLVYALQDLLG